MNNAEVPWLEQPVPCWGPFAQNVEFLLQQHARLVPLEGLATQQARAYILQLWGGGEGVKLHCYAEQARQNPCDCCRIMGACSEAWLYAPE